jgi:hypothetical protein
MLEEIEYGMDNLTSSHHVHLLRGPVVQGYGAGHLCQRCQI